MLKYLLKLLDGQEPFYLDVTYNDGLKMQGAVREADAHGVVLSVAADPSASVTHYNDLLVPWANVRIATVVPV